MAVGGQLSSEQIVEIGIQPALGHHLGVLALQRTAGSIARVGKEGLTLHLALPVEGLKADPRHQHLAADFKAVRIVAAVEYQRYGAYGLHVGSHIVALLTVATGDSPHQAPLLIYQRYAEAVKLQFTANIKRLAAQSLIHAVVKGLHIGTVIRVGERQHWVAVAHLDKLMAQVAAHSLRGRVGVVELGVPFLQLHQQVHLLVKFAVADGGRALHVVVIVVPVQLAAQAQYLVLVCHILLKE